METLVENKSKQCGDLYLEGIEIVVGKIIKEGQNNEQSIERILEIIIPMTKYEKAKKLFIALLSYYNKINTQRALFYWNVFDGM